MNLFFVDFKTIYMPIKYNKRIYDQDKIYILLKTYIGLLMISKSYRKNNLT